MTDTEFSSRILGTAWPQHMNKVVAETMHENIKAVGMPKWSDADVTLAKALQKELKAEERGLAQDVGKLDDPIKEPRGGGSDDIGDISWNLPTITLRYPSNIPNLPGHNWANAIAMATPIAHKGVTAGAKAQAMTVLDLLLRPELVEKAWAYFKDVQTKDVKYRPFIKDEPPATHLNVATMERYRSELRKHYYDPTKYKTYLEQLGIAYPTVRK
jgi:aminobenzoyl-glutamate utilization protein B